MTKTTIPKLKVKKKVTTPKPGSKPKSIAVRPFRPGGKQTLKGQTVYF